MDQFNPKILTQFRKLLYPAIAQGIITGYNVYNEPKDPTDTAIHYLHSDLGIDENGKMDRHLESLMSTIKNSFPNDQSSLLTCKIAGRYTIYQLGNWTENPKNVNFYDDGGRPLAQNAVKEHEGIVIIEGKQYDLSIRCENKIQRRDLMRLIYRYTLTRIDTYPYMYDKEESNRYS